MSTSTDSCHDLDMTEPKNRPNIYSPASSYSTFSREVKYIFNPLNESLDEERDYCHINGRSKPNYLSHTPRTLSASSQLSNKDNKAPHTSKEENGFDSLQHVPPQYVACSRTNSVLSNSCRTRGPVNTHMEEALYSSTRGYGVSKLSALSELNPGDRTYFSPSNDILSYPNARTSHPVLNNYISSQHPQNSQQKSSNYYNDINNKHNRNSLLGTGAHSFQNHHSLNNTHNSHHYQQPHIHPLASEPHHPHELNHSQEPPYVMPPRYSYQNHSRRKTWSPPAQKINISNAHNQASRVCLSNDSLDVAQDCSAERKTLSLSEDLDMTPPKLAPVSGVLAQKPGQNLIRPVAFKPINASSALSPGGHVPRQHPDDHMNGSHDTTRPHGMKPSTTLVGMQESPDLHNGRSNGAFSTMAKFQYYNPHSSGGCSQIPISSHHSIDNIDHSYPLNSYCPTADAEVSHNNSQHNLSASSQHNLSASSHHNLSASSQHNLSASSHHNASINSTTNIPANSHINVHSSRLCASDETSISSEFPSSERPDSIPSLNLSRVSSHVVEGMLQTPSPSDSGVGELEAMLREKDAEINTLREVMERNEHAIFQVYEERRNVWINELQELQNEYERRLKVQSRKSYKTEQVLSLQVYKLQQEQKILQDENSKGISERDMLRQQVDENQNLITHLKQKLEALLAGEIECEKQMESASGEADKNNKITLSLQEELASKNKDIIFLKSQFHSFQTEMEKKNKELAENFRELSAKTEEVKKLKNDLLHLRDPPVLADMSSQTCNELIVSEKASTMVESDHTISEMQEQLQEIRAQVSELKEEHEKERDQWLDEKNKVIRYQKQLQLNYVQMQRKNVALENEVQQLTLELENRDMKLIALSGEESIC